MLPGILRFEWRYHTRRIGFAAAAAGLALGSLALVGTGYGPAAVDVNAPYTVMQSLGLLSLLAVFALTIFCAEAGLRDAEHGMAEIVFATPVGKPRYLLGRFAGALLAATTAMAIAALVLMLAPLVMTVEPGRLGPVRPLGYLWALLVIVLPNLLLAGALLFAVATLTRSTLATYVGGVAIYALYFVCALLVDSPLMAGTAPPTPEGLARAAILDPFGLSAFFEQTRYWTPAERDVRLVSLGGHLLLNRLLWLAVAAGILALTYRAFAFRVGAAGGRARRGSTARNGAGRGARSGSGLPASSAQDAGGARRESTPGTTYRPVAPTARRALDWLAALRSATRLELRHVLRGWTFLALLAFWAFAIAMEAVAQLGGEYGTHVLATTGLMLDTMQLPLRLIGTITIVYYAAEVAWRERILGFDRLADATPAPSALFYLAKAGALCALPIVLALVAIVVGIVVQLANGRAAVEPGLYLSLLWFAGAPLALFAIAALALQALAPNRWVGLLAGLALALLARQGNALGLEHPMLRFGAAPTVGHSDMDGFGGTAASFAAFMLYWGAAAALLACVSWGVWSRGLDPGVRARLAALPRRWGRSGRRLALACAAIFGIAGGALFWQTNVAHAWESSEGLASWKAAYERAYRRLEDRPQPSIAAVRTTVDLDPAQRRADVAGTYTLENRTATPIDTLWVALRRDVARASVKVAGARLVRDDARFGVRVFRFDRPLAPGARTQLRFAGALERGGIRAEPADPDVASNGSYLTSLDAFPTLGYRATYELADPAARREHGLDAPPSALAPLPTSDSARKALRAAQARDAWLTLDATISTAADQTALAPGRLVRSWRTPGRRHFRYVTDRPITARFAFASARWAVRRVRHAGVDVELWYHPAHASNVDRMLVAATRTLDVLGPRYGAYPRGALRIAEVPSWWGFGAFAMPGLILFTEDRGFLADPRPGEVDLVTRRIAHEVAHQWWGHALDPAPVVGATTLVETLAKHSEQLVIASLHGDDALAPMIAFDEDRYLAGRAEDTDRERTLLDGTGADYLYYGKGAVVMNGLRGLLGGGAVDRALRRLIAEHGGPRADATTLDLLDALLAETTTPLQRELVQEWLADRVIYDLRVDSARARPLEGGKWRVDAWIRAGKTASRGGTDVPLAMEGEEIDVEVLGGAPGEDRKLYTAARPVDGGRIHVSVDVPARPTSVVVDPFVRRIDRDRTDNSRSLK